MGMRGIRVGTWGIKARMRGIRVGMWGIKLGMRGIRVGMRGMGLGMLGMWEMRGILLLLLFIYFSLALQMVHKIINYNMTN